MAVMIAQIASLIFGSKYQRDIRRLLPILRKINSLEKWALSLKEEFFPTQTQIFQTRLKKGETLEEILPEAFALAREACRRVLGERPYDVQILGGIVLHQGRITEMKTGEGKTLTSVTAAYLNALSGEGIHIVTVNDYLAERDSSWMGRVHNYLGLSVGVILANMDYAERARSYACDITYATNNELGFDYLRDNMRGDAQGYYQKNHRFAIIDEIDSILIDEARTPLIISGPVDEDTSSINLINGLVHFLKEVEKDPKTGLYPIEDPLVKTLHKGDFKLDEKSHSIYLTDNGLNKIENLLTQNNIIQGSLFDENNFEYTHYFTQAIKAHYIYRKDDTYVVQDNQVQIVDEFTGRILHGRRYSDGLHQAIEAKEGIKVAKRNVTLATITLQNFFRMYKKIAGMTGTADTEAHEFAKIYGLDVVVIPSNRPLVRIDHYDEIYFDEQFKFNAIVNEIVKYHNKGQPILLGTVSVEKSEKISALLNRKGVKHEILNAKNHEREAYIIAEAGSKGAVTIATNMAGRGTDIKLGGNPEMRSEQRRKPNMTEEEYQKILCEELKKWQKNYEEVCQLGGLYVIGTERHESRRIDNQLRGRSGRQGDPGMSKFYISLDDVLMRLFGGERFRQMMGRLGMDSGEVLQHPWVSRAIEHAQKRVEERNYEIRKHLLEYDDVLNKQRTYFYELRDNILQNMQLRDLLLHSSQEIIEDIMDNYEKFLLKGGDKTRESISYLSEQLTNKLGFNPDDLAAFIELPRENQIKSCLQTLTLNLEEKTAIIGEENLNQFLRFEYLKLLDDRWQNHLEMMEGLREAVNLRHYAQKSPLVEYKIDGFALFDEFIEAIPSDLISKVFKIHIVDSSTDRELEYKKNLTSITSTHRNPRNLAIDANNDFNPGQQIQTQRSEIKIGRNSPCPCQSGKKYKFCHGKENKNVKDD